MAYRTVGKRHCVGRIEDRRDAPAVESGKVDDEPAVRKEERHMTRGRSETRGETG